MRQSITAEIDQVMPAAVATGLFVSLCTIQVPSQTQGPTGNYISTYSDLSGAANIPCMDAPESTLRIQATELKQISEIMAKGLRHVLLSKCFPDSYTWAGKGYRAVIDGIVFDLLGAENDSQGTQTRISLQLATI